MLHSERIAKALRDDFESADFDASTNNGIDYDFFVGFEDRGLYGRLEYDRDYMEWVAVAFEDSAPDTTIESRTMLCGDYINAGCSVSAWMEDFENGDIEL